MSFLSNPFLSFTFFLSNHSSPFPFPFFSPRLFFSLEPFFLLIHPLVPLSFSLLLSYLPPSFLPPSSSFFFGFSLSYQLKKSPSSLPAFSIKLLLFFWKGSSFKGLEKVFSFNFPFFSKVLPPFFLFSSFSNLLHSTITKFRVDPRIVSRYQELSKRLLFNMLFSL